MLCLGPLNKYSKEKLIAGLRKVDWNSVTEEPDVNIAATKLNKNVADCIESIAPMRVVQNPKNFVPWLTEETLALMRLRDDTRLTATNTLDPDIWKEWRRLRNLCNHGVDMDRVN